MSPKRHLPAHLLMSTAIALALTACGGGGSGPAFVPPVTTVAPVTYQQTYPQDLAAFVPDVLAISSGISDLRSASAAGLLSQSPALDQAALAHLSYLFTNHKIGAGAGEYLSALQPVGSNAQTGVLGAHYQDASLPGYTGRTPADRATAAKYQGSVAEIVSFGAASGAACLGSLKNSVYHLIGLMSPFMDVGIAFKDVAGTGSACVVEIGTPANSLGQLPEKGRYLTYPAAYQAAVPPVFYNKAEIPSPGVGLDVAGHPILVSLYNQELSVLSANAVRVRSFSIRPAVAGSLPVSARILARPGVTVDSPLKSEPDENIIGNGFVVLLPEVPLDASTEYQVSFTADVTVATSVQASGIVPVNLSWRFTTGPAN